MSEFRIRVTQQDIEQGRQSQSYNCAIARALRRQIPYAQSIAVTVMHTTIDHNSYTNTREMADFIGKFDKSKELVFPTEFVIDLDKALVCA